ncbi:hypothetical protein AMTR_s00063p00160760 [Amborella trichopoda]|uniref:Uncharacterized protein n=1 Tax=Amborella trichopoda TaxID=13333 RepID=U5D1Z9_AMBTC|nr:hypothetical protein AMTR_s00063p00160760 [Amborella trichopoda]
MVVEDVILLNVILQGDAPLFLLHEAIPTVVRVNAENIEEPLVAAMMNDMAVDLNVSLGMVWQELEEQRKAKKLT